MGKDKGRLSAQRMQAEEQHAALMAVEHALTATQQLAVCAEAFRRWPRMRGAKVADILDITVDHDMFLDQTEPFFELHGDELPDGLNYAPIYAAHALIILGERLNVPAVLKLLFRAGVLDTGHEVAVRNIIVDEVADEMTRAWDLNYCTEPNTPKLDQHQALLMARHAMSRLSVIRDRDHIDPLS